MTFSGRETIFGVNTKANFFPNKPLSLLIMNWLTIMFLAESVHKINTTRYDIYAEISYLWTMQDFLFTSVLSTE